MSTINSKRKLFPPADGREPIEYGSEHARKKGLHIFIAIVFVNLLSLFGFILIFQDVEAKNNCFKRTQASANQEQEATETVAHGV